MTVYGVFCQVFISPLSDVLSSSKSFSPSFCLWSCAKKVFCTYKMVRGGGVDSHKGERKSKESWIIFGTIWLLLMREYCFTLPELNYTIELCVLTAWADSHTCPIWASICWSVISVTLSTAAQNQELERALNSLTPILFVYDFISLW